VAGRTHLSNSPPMNRARLRVLPLRAIFVARCVTVPVVYLQHYAPRATATPARRTYCCTVAPALAKKAEHCFCLNLRTTAA